MSFIISKHPTLQHSSDLNDICRPLKKLGISYFSHVRIKDKSFSSLSNNPEFAEMYFRNKYYNSDIHLADENILSNYIIWDVLSLTGKTKEMDDNAEQFKIYHTFTVIEKKKNEKNFYHFSTDIISNSFNQVYITNLELLKLFILHFNDNIKQSPSLSIGYDMRYDLDEETNGFYTSGDLIALSDEIKSDFKNNLKLSAKAKQLFTKIQITQPALSKRQHEVATLLLKGGTARSISEVLFISERTVEHHIEHIKQKLGAESKSDLIKKLVE